MTCEQVRNCIPDYLAGELDRETVQALTEHLESCEDCRKALDSERKLSELIAGSAYLPERSLSEAFLADVRKPAKKYARIPIWVRGAAGIAAAFVLVILAVRLPGFNQQRKMTAAAITMLDAADSAPAACEEAYAIEEDEEEASVRSEANAPVIREKRAVRTMMAPASGAGDEKAGKNGAEEEIEEDEELEEALAANDEISGDAAPTVFDGIAKLYAPDMADRVSRIVLARRPDGYVLPEAVRKAAFRVDTVDGRIICLLPDDGNDDALAALTAGLTCETLTPDAADIPGSGETYTLVVLR